MTLKSYIFPITNAALGHPHSLERRQESRHRLVTGPLELPAADWWKRHRRNNRSHPPPGARRAVDSAATADVCSRRRSGSARGVATRPRRAASRGKGRLRVTLAREGVSGRGDVKCIVHNIPRGRGHDELLEILI